MKKELIKRIEALPAKDGKGRPFVDKKIVIGLIQTMDEPKQPTLDSIIHRIKFMEEDLKQEWLSKILKELGSDFEFKKFQEGFKSGSWIGRQLINADKIRQELNKPVIPQFVADWIEECKNDDFHLFGAMEAISLNQKKLDYWFREDDNMELFARAWLDGYEVEEEKRYLVKMKGIDTDFNSLNRHRNENYWIFSSKDKNTLYQTHHTRKELEEAGFGWIFDCEGVEVEEVTE
nr:MAG TPA: Protein of unknown function (DUF1642) [Caudoviricetes sp.]